MGKKTILLYGRSRSGKTAQIGELAEHVLKTYGKLSRVYTADKGGTDTIKPYIDLGIIEVVEQGDTDPWIFLHQACKGKVRYAPGKWVDGDNTNIGMFAFESLTSFSDALMASMAKKAADGVNIGGGSNISFNVVGDGITLKVGGANMAHYGVCQARVTEEAWNSQTLPADFIVWTAGVAKDDDPNASGKLLGPASAGNALTHKWPGWFNLTFRIDALPSEAGKPERHILYLGNHKDVAAGNAVGLGNTRTAMDSPPLPTLTIEPASIVKALNLIDSGGVVATDVVAKRVGKELLDRVKALRKS